MRVLYCHNYYRNRGGEDYSFEADVEVLRDAGHAVETFTLDNCDLGQQSQLRTATNTIWNRQSAAKVRELVRAFRPDVLHCNNTFPQISPSVYREARRVGIPVVQALRNYRLFCVNSFLYRDGQVCEKCLSQTLPLAGIKHACYRDSRSASAVVASLQVTHGALKTYRRRVSMFFTPTEFARQICIRGGIDADQIMVKTNFANDASVGGPTRSDARENRLVFVGRVSPEKGIRVLLDAWRKANLECELWIVGTGPDESLIQSAAAGDARIKLLGFQSNETVLKILAHSSGLIMPSLWYETFGRTICESFSVGTPVIGSSLGAIAELIIDGESGYLFKPGDSDDLANTISNFMASGTRRERLMAGARKRFMSQYTRQHSYEQLLEVYRGAGVSGVPSEASELGPQWSAPRVDQTTIDESTTTETHVP
ncbi:MAG: glycosyltransferase [Planctomycetota bacterium]